MLFFFTLTVLLKICYFELFSVALNFSRWSLILPLTDHETETILLLAHDQLIFPTYPQLYHYILIP